MALSHTILAMLYGDPQSGYELQKDFCSSSSCCWQAAMQQVYKELSKLKEQGLIVPQEVVQNSRPNKKLYSITPEGEEILKKWIAQPSKLSPIREELVVKVLVAHLISPHIMGEELRRQKQYHQEQLTTYQELWKYGGCEALSTLTFPEQCKCMTFRRGIYHENSWISWCEETMLWLEQSRDTCNTKLQNQSDRFIMANLLR